MTTAPSFTRLDGLPDLWTADEAAEYLRIALPTVYAMVRDGRLRAVKGLGRRVVIPKTAITELLGTETPHETD